MEQTQKIDVKFLNLYTFKKNYGEKRILQHIYVCSIF